MGSLTEPLTHQLLTLAVQQALGLLLPPRPPLSIGVTGEQCQPSFYVGAED